MTSAANSFPMQIQKNKEQRVIEIDISKKEVLSLQLTCFWLIFSEAMRRENGVCFYFLF